MASFCSLKSDALPYCCVSYKYRSKRTEGSVGSLMVTNIVVTTIAKKKMAYKHKSTAVNESVLVMSWSLF